MKTDPNGPHIDLREELITHLGQRVTMLTDYQLPITTSSERLLFAVEANDEKAVAAALEKCLKNDPTVKRRVIDGHVIWELIEEESAKVPAISLRRDPVAGAKKERARARRRATTKAKRRKRISSPTARSPWPTASSWSPRTSTSS